MTWRLRTAGLEWRIKFPTSLTNETEKPEWKVNWNLEIVRLGEKREMWNESEPRAPQSETNASYSVIQRQTHQQSLITTASTNAKRRTRLKPYNKVFKIAKFEFKVTVHYGLNAPSCEPLKVTSGCYTDFVCWNTRNYNYNYIVLLNSWNC